MIDWQAEENLAQQEYSLRRVAMVRPNSKGIYAPSRLQPDLVKMTLEKFAKYLAVDSLVSFEEDGYSNPQKRLMYGYGLDCWYILDDSELE